MKKTRKELFQKWSPERIKAFLKAENNGKLQEVPAGWLVNNVFMEKFPFKGEALTSYFEYLAERD